MSTSPETRTTGVTLTAEPQAGVVSEFQQEWDAWHAQHEAVRADRHGFLAITGITFLDEEPREVPGLPGLFSAVDGVVTVTLAEGEHLSQSGADLNPGGEGSTTVLEQIAERAGATLTYKDVSIELARRGGYVVVRPRDPEFGYLASYEGTPSYPANPDFVVEARVETLETPVAVTVGSVTEGIEHVYEVPAKLHFTLGGEEHVLSAFNGYKPNTLSVLFTDATSGVTTYAANRSLSVVPAEDGTVTLDFNRSTNLPCAYTDFATCPLPPAGNRLSVAVEAGEKKPLSRAEAAAEIVAPGVSGAAASSSSATTVSDSAEGK